uniref:GGDEF domain-containing protein n=2 Tax=Vibrio ziniensis TaxID=2711221 RepID=A0A6G7CR34_9VIBR|nr:GGDEF domain-containing protein [Vibrio ziniensis]
MISALTVFGIVFLGIFSAFCFYKGETLLSITLALYTGFSCLTIWLLPRWKELGLICLTIIIYSLSLFLVLTGGYEGTGALWVYPLAAIGIFINQFKQGLVLSFLFITSIAVVLALNVPVYQYSTITSIRFLITMIALSGMCHILIYFQMQMDEYIMKMHDEGISELAYIDSLTTLANRSSFNSILYHSMQLSHQPMKALIYIDLDNFKSINDNHGHTYGDLVLSEFGISLKQLVAQAFKDTIGPYDVARVGGDEFALLIKEYSDECQVLNVAEKVIELFSEVKLPSLHGLNANVSASIGVVFVDTQKLNLNDCLHLADKAMYQAKIAGKGRYKVITPQEISG